MTAVNGRREHAHPPAAARRHHPKTNPHCSAAQHQHQQGPGPLTRRREGIRGHVQRVAASAATWDEQTPPEGVIAAIEAEDSAAGKITFAQAVSNTLNIMVCTRSWWHFRSVCAARGFSLPERHCMSGLCSRLSADLHHHTHAHECT